MKRHLIAGITLAALTAVASSAAFADGGQGIGRAGTYQTQETSTGSTLTRAQVRAELAAAYSDGSLPALNRNTYPARSMLGNAVAAQHERRAHDAALAEARNRGIVDYANGSAVTAH